MDTGRCLANRTGKAVLLSSRSIDPRVATEPDHRLGLWSQRTVDKSSHLEHRGKSQAILATARPGDLTVCDSWRA